MTTGKTGTSGGRSRVGPGVVLLVGLLLALLVLAALIPFNYPSQTLLYKFGVDRTVLRLGKVAGLLAGTLLLVQIIPVAHAKIVESVVPRGQLLRSHQIGGILLLLLGFIHPLLVFWPEDLRTLAVEWRYWPEVLGAALLLALTCIVAVAKLRGFLRMSGPAWMRFHRIGTAIAAGALVVHTLFVSDTFKQTVPRTAVFVGIGLYLAVWLKLRLEGYRRVAAGRPGRSRP